MGKTQKDLRSELTSHDQSISSRSRLIEIEIEIKIETLRRGIIKRKKLYVKLTGIIFGRITSFGPRKDPFCISEIKEKKIEN